MTGAQRRWEDRAELADRLERHAELLQRLVTENPQRAGLLELAEDARQRAQAARDRVGPRPPAPPKGRSRRAPQASAGDRMNAQVEAGWRAIMGGATPPPMAYEQHEYITLAEAGRRIRKPNGEPRSERTMQDWAQRGLLPIHQVSPHVRFVDWTLYLNGWRPDTAGKSVTMEGEGADAPATDTPEE